MDNQYDNNQSVSQGSSFSGGSFFEPDQGDTEQPVNSPYEAGNAEPSFDQTQSGYAAQDESSNQGYVQSDAYAQQPQADSYAQQPQADSYAQQPQADPYAQQPQADPYVQQPQADPYAQPNYGQQPQADPYAQPNYGQQAPYGGSQPDYSQTGYQQPVGYQQDQAPQGGQNQFQYSAPQGGYQPQPGGQDTRPMNSMAVISLVCGAVSVLLSLIGIFTLNLILAILSGVAGIILGSMAGKTLTETSPQQGKSLATAGLICGIVGAALALLVGVSCYACWTCTLSSVSQYW
jgi:hypothetical protein